MRFGGSGSGGSSGICGHGDGAHRNVVAKVARYNFKDLTGQVFGKLTVVSRIHSPTGEARWLCRCECGTEVEFKGISLRERVKRGKPMACVDCRPPRSRVYKRKAPDPDRRPRVRLCRLCWGLAHRVQGPKCRACGRLYHSGEP